MTGAGDRPAREAKSAPRRAREFADYRVAIVGGRGLLGRALLASSPAGWGIYAPARLAADSSDPSAGGQAGGGAAADAKVIGPQRQIAAEGLVDLESPQTLEVFLDSHPCDAVVLTAAWTAVDACESDPGRAMRVNGDAPGHLAGIAARRGLTFLYLSTDYVFDGGFDGGGPRPYHEDDEPRPQSVYARSKLAGEREVARAYAEAGRGSRDGQGGRYLIVRASGLYGPGGPDFVHAVAPRLSQGALVVDDQRLSPTCVDDLAPGLWSLLASGARGLFHLTASGGGVSWFDFARRMAEELGYDPEAVEPTTSTEFGRPAPRPGYSVLDCGRAEAAIGRALSPWDAGLVRFLREGGAKWRAAGSGEGSGV